MFTHVCSSGFVSRAKSRCDWNISCFIAPILEAMWVRFFIDVPVCGGAHPTSPKIARSIPNKVIGLFQLT
jgi:hypothetical protein